MIKKVHQNHRNRQRHEDCTSFVANIRIILRYIGTECEWFSVVCGADGAVMFRRKLHTLKICLCVIRWFWIASYVINNSTYVIEKSLTTEKFSHSKTLYLLNFIEFIYMFLTYLTNILSMTIYVNHKYACRILVTNNIFELCSETSWLIDSRITLFPPSSVIPHYISYKFQTWPSFKADYIPHLPLI